MAGGSKTTSNLTAKPSDPDQANSSPKHGWEFWLLFFILCTVSLIAALESTIITTALPGISEDVEGARDRYVWIANSFILCSTVFQPLYGQTCDILGRKGPYTVALGFFILGSGICGGSSTSTMLIIGRTIQGIGSAGMFVLSDLIICDLVPLRQRSKYMGIILAIAAIGAALGPVLGGALVASNWRWCFYINLPIAVPCLGTILCFTRLRHQSEPTWASAFARIDLIGYLIFIPSILSLLIGLVLGGSSVSWSSWRAILPIALGIIGWVTFHIYEASSYCKNPSLPPHLFSNRTTISALFLTFLAGSLFNWMSYFFPFYFQAVYGASPTWSGVYMLPVFISLIFSSAIAGFLLSKLGSYKPLHWSGFALVSVGLGLASTLNPTSHTVVWVIAEIITSAGLATLLTTLLPAVLAPLSEKDVATATAAFGFLRSLGLVFGVTIPAVVFNNSFSAHSGAFRNLSNQLGLSNGAAYGFVVSPAMQNLDAKLRELIIKTYTVSIQYVWWVALAFSLLGVIVTFFERKLELRSSLDTDFGIAKSEAHSNHSSALELGSERNTDK